MLISVIVLGLILVAFSSLLPSGVRISRAIDIMATGKNVGTLLKNLKQWEQWNEYTKALPYKYAADDSIGSKELTVLLIKMDNTSVITKWRQQNGKSFAGVFNIIDHGSVTTVQWYFEFSIKWYPWEKFGSIVYDKQLGPQMEQSLLNLKQLLEKADNLR